MSSLSAPQTQRFQEKREAILNAAAVQFNLHGVKGATLSGIAASVGLATNSVTYYYRKKEDLASACFLRAIEAFTAVAVAASAEATVQARIRAYFRKLALLFRAIELREHPPLVAFNDMRAMPEAQFAEASAAYTAMFRQVRALLRADATRDLSPADRNARTYALLSMGHWMRAWIGRHDTVEYIDMADRCTDILVHGCAGAGSVWSEGEAAERQWHFRAGGDPTVEAFLRAASQMVNEHGYQGASVDKISAQLNVTKGSFYHHNDNKEDLIWACFERSFGIIRHALDLTGREFGTGWERACATARALARFQLSADGPLLRLGAISAINDPARRADVGRSMHRLTLRLSTTVIDGIIDGSVRPVDPNVAGHIATGIISGAAGLNHWVKEVNQENVSRLYLRPMFIGILCPPSGS